MRRATWLSVVLLGLVPVTALAQAPKEQPRPPASSPAPASPPVPATPEHTTASFGDWVMRCDASSAKRVCEVAQMMTIQGQSAPVAQIAIGRPAKGEALRLTVVLPTNVMLTIKPKVFEEKNDRFATELSWLRCIPGGCIANAPIADDLAARLGARTAPGGIAFQDAAEREVVLPLSFRGLTQALAALNKEP